MAYSKASLKLSWEEDWVKGDDITTHPKFGEIETILSNLSKKDIIRIAEEDGFLDLDIGVSSFEDLRVTFDSIIARYKIVFYDPDNEKIYKSYNFIIWDGNSFHFDVSGDADEV
jgi:hypothetical protein